MRPTLAAAFGRVIARHRKEAKLSQMKLAELAGLHLNAVGLIERGERLPSLYTIILLARSLEAQPQELVSETMAQHPSLD